MVKKQRNMGIIKNSIKIEPKYQKVKILHVQNNEKWKIRNNGSK